MSIVRIMHGGQTGGDRGGAEAAMALGLAHGGWVPRGRRAEDGEVPAKYTGMRETMSAAYSQRTRLNVQHSDAVVLFCRGPLTPGTRLTMSIAQTLGRPLLVLNLRLPDAARQLTEFLGKLPASVRTLCVAGSRESLAPGIQDEVREMLTTALGGAAEHQAEAMEG